MSLPHRISTIWSNVLPKDVARVLTATTFAGLIGVVMAHGPQPITDRVTQALPASSQTQVVLVSMDGAEGIVQWQEATQRVRDIGVPVVAAIHAPAGELNALGFHSARGVQADAGLLPGWDGTNRSWRAADGNRATLPARVRYAAGDTSAGNLSFSGESPAQLHYSHLAYLSPQALSGKVVVLGLTDPWVAPMVQTSMGRLPLAEVVARSVASPGYAPAGAGITGLLAALAGLFGALTVLSSSRRRMAAISVGVSATGSLGLLALGSVLPIEALLAGGLSGAAVAGTLVWSKHHLSFVSLVDRAVWHLNVQPARSPVDESWLELAVAAVELGVAREAYVMEGQGQDAVLRAAADQSGVLQVSELPPPFPNPLVMQLPMYGERRAQLVMRATVGVDPELRALRTLAAHQARQVAEQAPRFDASRGYVAHGVAVIEAAFDALLRRSDSLGGALRAGVGARAVFDPLGRLMSSDQRIETLIFPEGRPLEPRLAQVWSAAGGLNADISAVLTGGETRRLLMEDGGLLALSAIVDGHRLAGMLVEYIPAAEAPVSAPNPVRASFRR